MNNTSYDPSSRAAATPAGERTHAGGGYAVVFVLWLLAAAALVGIGGPVFFGILKAVT